MTYDEVISGLEALQPSDFDDSKTDSAGRERLYELTDALLLLPSPERAIPALFAVMERMPEADLGSPGPLVHTLERLRGYETELIRSVSRCPSLLSVWMLNRLLNSDLPDEKRARYSALLDGVANDSSVHAAVRADARDFLRFQSDKS